LRTGAAFYDEKEPVMKRIDFGFLDWSRALALVSGMLCAAAASAAEGRAAWQQDWERTVAGAEKEGQVTIYAPPGKQHQDALGGFQEAYPKIKLNYVPGSGTNNAQRLLSERRGEKYLADVFVGGSGTLILVLFKAGILAPLPPLLALPENRDPTLWFSRKHTYADPKSEHVFMFEGSVQTDIGAYNTRLVNPNEIKSYWDVLNPKWKGKMAAFDPKARGHIQRMRAIYYNPALGGEFLRRLFSEMDVIVARDQRQLLDWVASGKTHIYLFGTSTEIADAQKKGLPIGALYGPPEEAYMSGGFGHAAVIDRAPHPNAAKVLINWLLSKAGQLGWQEKTDNNSLRTDIPKSMLSDQNSIPQEGKTYLNTSLPQYEDVKPLLKIVDEALTAGKKQ
jgi:iron(III) transport system substrate-binding protein